LAASAGVVVAESTTAALAAGFPGATPGPGAPAPTPGALPVANALLDSRKRLKKITKTRMNNSLYCICFSIAVLF
jgi:hypothetical protein